MGRPDFCGSRGFEEMQSGPADFYGVGDRFALGMKGGELRKWLLARGNELLPLQHRLGLRQIGGYIELRGPYRPLDQDDCLGDGTVARIPFAKTGDEVGNGGIGLVV